jgi:hypothetical protein
MVLDFVSGCDIAIFVIGDAEFVNTRLARTPLENQTSNVLFRSLSSVDTYKRQRRYDRLKKRFWILEDFII